MSTLAKGPPTSSAYLRPIKIFKHGIQGDPRRTLRGTSRGISEGTLKGLGRGLVVKLKSRSDPVKIWFNSLNLDSEVGRIVDKPESKF